MPLRLSDMEISDGRCFGFYGVLGQETRLKWTAEGMESEDVEDITNRQLLEVWLRRGEERVVSWKA